jgi:hypothetical protein
MAYITHTLGALNLTQISKWKPLMVGMGNYGFPREQDSFVNATDGGDLVAYDVERSPVWPFAFLVGGTSTTDLRANIAALRNTLGSAVLYQTTQSGAPVDYVWRFGDMGTTEVWEVVNFKNYREDWRELGFNRVTVNVDLVLTQQ